MNNLQKLIKLRGLTIREVADRIGHGYHITQKVIKRTTWRNKSGGQGTYSNPAIETAVADLLGLTHEQAWGPGSALVLRRLIRQEIKDQVSRQEASLRKQWLPNESIVNGQVAGNV